MCPLNKCNFMGPKNKKVLRSCIIENHNKVYTDFEVFKNVFTYILQLK